MRPLLCCGLCLIIILAAVAEPLPADAMIRPARPKSFASPDDLRTYLNQLGQYYAVAGRPRFGKRTGNFAYSGRLHLPSESSNFRYPEASSLFDFLYQPLADGNV